MSALVLTFTQDKETPGTIRFREDGDKAEHKVGSLYLRKGSAMQELGGPEKIKVTIEVGS